MKDTRGFCERALHADPVTEVIAHVIAAEREHGHRIAAHFPNRAECSGSHL